MSNIRWFGAALLLLVSCAGRLSAQEPAQWHDPSPHKIQFVTVDENVKLEVLDWGGSGRPLVLLAGLGNTAHVFDDFAPKLTSEYHVYGITRRGYGTSTVPASGYSADRLGDDVLAVLDALKIDRPVLVGHSLAGEELSSVGTRHPERIAGLVYLDAGFPYAYYDRSRGDLFDFKIDIDWNELKKEMDQALFHTADRPIQEQLTRELLHTTLPAFEKDLQQIQETLTAAPPPMVPPAPTAADLESFIALRSYQMRVFGSETPEAELRQTLESTLDGHVGPPKDHAQVVQAVIEGMRKYTDIRVPVLAIFAVPHDQGPYAKGNPAALAAFDATDVARMEGLAKSFETGVPSARVVRLPHASHFVFISNEADVLREMRGFLAHLP